MATCARPRLQSGLPPSRDTDAGYPADGERGEHDRTRSLPNQPQGIGLKPQDAHLDMSVEHMLKQLDGLQEIVLVYPSSTPGPKPTAKVDTRESLDQIQLIETLGLDRLHGRKSG